MLYRTASLILGCWCCASVPAAEEALQGAEVPEEGAAGGGGADLVSMRVRAVQIRSRYDHDTVMIRLRYK